MPSAGGLPFLMPAIHAYPLALSVSVDLPRSLQFHCTCDKRSAEAYHMLMAQIRKRLDS